MTGDESQAGRAARAADAAAVSLDREAPGVDKLATGIAGFDHVAMGGLPRHRATVLAGMAGSAKTVLAGQFLAEGVRRNQPGVFVTLEEDPEDLRRNFATLGWDVVAWEEHGDWAFVDASPRVRDDGTPVPYSFAALAAQIGHAVDATGAERLVIDSLNTVFGLEAGAGIARQQLRVLVGRLRAAGLTVVMTVETPGDPAESLSSFGIEEFVADNVVLLRHAREGKGRRRTLEILKMRGAAHLKGDVGFTVLPGEGVVVLPVTQNLNVEGRPRERVPTGVAGLDAMTGGGFARDCLTLLAGPTGTGKTLLALEFLAVAAAAGDRCLLLAYEESPGQIGRNAVGAARRYDELRASGALVVRSAFPDEWSLEDHLLQIKQLVATLEPQRVVIDSLTALEQAGSAQAYREFLAGLTAFLKEREITSLLTATTARDGSSSSDAHVSTLADAVVYLRYVEQVGEVGRALAVLKMRGSAHDRAVRWFTIDDDGLHVGEPLDVAAGLLT